MSCANQDDRKKKHNIEYLDFCLGSEIGSYFVPFGGGGKGRISILICKVRAQAEVISKYPSISINSEST